MALIRIVVPTEVMGFFRMLDNPFLYTAIMTFGLLLVPFYIRMVRDQLKNPENYHMVSFERTLWTGFLLITVMVLYGAVNLWRFL